MFVKLVCHTFPDRPDWPLVDKSIPIGTIYEVIAYDSDMLIYNKDLNESRRVRAYMLAGNGDVGFIPVDVFEVVNG